MYCIKYVYVILPDMSFLFISVLSKWIREGDKGCKKVVGKTCIRGKRICDTRGHSNRFKRFFKINIYIPLVLLVVIKRITFIRKNFNISNIKNDITAQ